MTYSIEFTRAAAKGLGKLQTREKEKIPEILNGLTEMPRPESAKALVGHDDLLRIRMGNYRIVYRVEEDILIVLLIAIGHRKDVYRKL